MYTIILSLVALLTPMGGQSQAVVPPEYRYNFIAEGGDPDWRATVRPGEVRITLAGQAERVIPLRDYMGCFVVGDGCQGVMFEQRVSHRHHGASIVKQDCRLPGSDEVYPYRISVSVLSSPRDTRGVTYRGCGRPEAQD